MREGAGKGSSRLIVYGGEGGINCMELDLEAVSRALEGLMAPFNPIGGVAQMPRQRSKRATRSSKVKSAATSSAGGVDVGRNNAHEAVVLSSNVIESSQGKQEVLVASSKTNQTQQPRRRECRPSPCLVPSPNQIPCKLVEASGLGASAVLLGGGTARMRSAEDKVWKTNLPQTPNPYIVLNCSPKNYFRKELISHVTPTISSPGSRVERVRDITVSIVLDTVPEALEKPEAVIERLVLSCSNHPRTGYVKVLHVSDIVSSVMRAVVPGTLIAPFLKVTLFPSDTVGTKVVRVSAVEVAHADSWTERRVIEEPQGPVSEEEDSGLSDPVNSPPKASGTKVQEECHTENSACPPSLKAEGRIGNSSLANFSSLISPVGSEHEDGGSILGSRVLQGKQPDLQGHATDLVARDAIGVCEAPRMALGKKQAHPGNRAEGTELLLTRSRERDGMKVPKLLKESQVTDISKPPQAEHGFEARELKPSLVMVNEKVVQETSSCGADTNRQRLSKALIAWGIKRQILQDKSIMRSLHEDCEDSFHTWELNQQGLEGRSGMCSDSLCCRGPEEAHRSLEVLQARCIWDAVSLWSRHDALLEAMTSSSTLCLTTARTSEEIFASLPQPYDLQVLLVLSGGVQDQTSSGLECFDLMMAVAHGERQRGREAELVFRMDNGFGCILHPHRDVGKGRQWLLVSLHCHTAGANEWMLEALQVYEEISRGQQLCHEQEPRNSSPASILSDELVSVSSPPVLRSVLDFACLFESLLPALLPWLSVGDMCYYGDVQPALFPFINDCGVIRPTCWFHCILHGVVRSVLLSLPGSDEMTTSSEWSRGTLPTTRRRLICMTLRKHIPFCAVWQPQINAVKTVLTNAHVLHCIELIDGVLLGHDALTVVRALLPHVQGKKFELLEGDNASVMGTPPPSTGGAAGMAVSPSGSAETSGVAFQVLSVSLRRSWTVVGLVLPMEVPFDEDAFMDTVFRWAYVLPRVVVLFFCEHVVGETLPPLSMGFMEAFAPVPDVTSALAA